MALVTNIRYDLEVGNIKIHRIWRLPSVTLASSFINSNLVWTRIVGSLLQSYCKCCRGRTAVPSCNHHHHHYQHSHYHYYLHKYYHCHYPNNGLHVVIIRVFNNEDFTLTTASTVSIFGGLRCPEILPDGLCFIWILHSYLDGPYDPRLFFFWVLDKVGCFHDSIIQWPTLKTVIQKKYEDPLTLGLVMDE